MLKKRETDTDIIEETELEDFSEDEESPGRSRLFVVISIIIAIAIVVAGAVFFVLFFCNIEKINMTGNTILVQEEIEQDLMVDEYDKNAVILLIRNHFKPRHDIPFVESMDMKMEDLNTVSIEIHEKELTGYIMDSDKNRIYYNSKGVVQEISKLKIKGIPRVVYEGELPAMKQGSDITIRDKSRRELLSLHRDLKNNEIKVSRIEITEEGSFTMYYKDIVIKLGPASNMTEKIMRLKYILPKVKKRIGTLHLEDWNEGNTDIVFEVTE